MGRRGPSASSWPPRVSRWANLTYAHLVKRFGPTLSPLELVPSVQLATKAMHFGRKQLTPDMPFLTRMLAPLPHLG